MYKIDRVKPHNVLIYNFYDANIVRYREQHYKLWWVTEQGYFNDGWNREWWVGSG